MIVVGLPSLGLDRRAQDLMSSDHDVERPLQRGDIELAFEANGFGFVVSRLSGFDLLHEPDAFLGRAQRAWLADIAHRDRLQIIVGLLTRRRPAPYACAQRRRTRAASSATVAFSKKSASDSRIFVSFAQAREALNGLQ